jgi:glutamate-1-semialdehyde 2,1-aminomutase
MIRLRKMSAYLVKGLQEVAAESTIPTCIQRVGGMFCLYFQSGPVTNFAEALNSDTDIFAKYFRMMLEQGVNLAPTQFESGFMSIAHGQDELDRTIEAAREVFRVLS